MTPAPEPTIEFILITICGDPHIVEGFPLTLLGISEFCVHEVPEGVRQPFGPTWAVSHTETGHRVVGAFSREDAERKVQVLIESMFASTDQLRAGLDRAVALVEAKKKEQATT